MSTVSKTILTLALLISCPFIVVYAALRAAAVALLAYMTNLIEVWE